MTATCHENRQRFTLNDIGISLLYRLNNLLKSEFIEEYLSPSYVVACEIIRQQLVNGTAYDPQNSFFRIHAMLTHNPQHSIHYSKILKKGVLYREIRNQAKLLMEINELIHELKKYPKGGDLFSWNAPPTSIIRRCDIILS